jgi:dTDP-glucose pyrophosphorylase
MVFVVLDEHCRDFQIDRRIIESYPQARIVNIPETTSGAAETALIGLDAVTSGGPVAINDCDHAFFCPGLSNAATELASSVDGTLLCFRSESPLYSYARIGRLGNVVGTVEKAVVSEFAIAGCYLFANPATFSELYQAYRIACPYDELFISGLVDLMIARGRRVTKVDAEHHCSFGTPEEYKRVLQAGFERYLAWK